MKKIYYLLLATFLFTIHPQALLAQKLTKKTINPGFKKEADPVICYFTTEDMHTAVPLREELEKFVAGRLKENQEAEMIVDYIGFDSEQQLAFQRAVDIWAGLLTSDVPVRIHVTMTSALGQGVLASAGPSSLYRNLDNFQDIDTWFATALAEKVLGEPLNEPGDPDIVMRFNTGINWYTGIDQNPGSGQYDFVTIALHEIAHGLGFLTLSSVTDGEGTYTYGLPTPYGKNLENGSGENIHKEYSANSNLFGTELTSDNLFFRSFAFDNPSLPKIYAPFEYNGGSSISHLDEIAYPAGNPNSLMSPQAGASESIHDPGLALEMLEDMGWIAMDMDHTVLLDSEDSVSARNITATVAGDNMVISDGVNLHYTYTDWTAKEVIPMTATANPNEYTSEIPSPGVESPISYYIVVEDTEGRIFTKPGEAPDYFLQYNVGLDKIPPTLEHLPLQIILVNDPVVNIIATVEDNIGAGPMTMSYRINQGPEADIEIPLLDSSTDGSYFAEHQFEWDLRSFNLREGDILEYRLSVTDVSSAGNTTNSPRNSNEFYEVSVEALLPAQNFYSTSFDEDGVSGDFKGSGFAIEAPAGFANNALHSDHPYRVGAAASPDDTLILEQILRVPIILAANNATIRFEEIVLVEPGEGGSSFGSDDFWDYVVVEGSTDFGTTWFPFESGYDSRANTEWLTTYNSNLVTLTEGDIQWQDSQAAGDAALFRPREIDMLSTDQFIPGEQVLIRFKLYADQLAAGWGWAIDNLKIQFDDVSPVIAHIPSDYVSPGDSQLPILAKITDNAVIDSVIFELNIDGQTEIIIFDEEIEAYELNINLTGVTESTSIKYRIIAVDSADSPNTVKMPEIGFFEVPVAVLGEVKTVYLNDFNNTTDDFISTNYEVHEVSGFSNPALHSSHPYSNSPGGTVFMTSLLKYPIKLEGSSSMMSYLEVGLVDPVGDGLTVQVSNDNGTTWHKVIVEYTASDDSDWSITYLPRDFEGNSTGVGSSDLYRYRLLNLQNPDEINSGDEVLVRFTMLIDDSKYGWGWAIDDVEIQGPTTGIEDKISANIQIYPNPSQDGKIQITGHITGNNSRISVTDILSHVVHMEEYRITQNKLDASLDLTHLRKGIYVIQIATEESRYSSRVVIK